VEEPWLASFPLTSTPSSDSPWDQDTFLFVMSDTPALSAAPSSAVSPEGTIATPTAEPTNDANSTVVVDELDPLLGSTSEPAKKEADLVDVRSSAQ
jgi:hypothetical protein